MLVHHHCGPSIIRFVGKFQQSLKETLHRVVPEKQKEVKEFRKEFGDVKLGEYTIDQVCEVIFGHAPMHAGAEKSIAAV